MMECWRFITVKWWAYLSACLMIATAPLLKSTVTGVVQLRELNKTQSRLKLLCQPFPFITDL